MMEDYSTKRHNEAPKVKKEFTMNRLVNDRKER